jgi:hypothetical protein
MPRFVNLKGSMNTFDNNKPVLSSSERLKNKRDKTIYQTQKLNYQTTKNCGNRNVRYYNNGTVRSTNSYKMNMKLSRGAVLCEDCDENGILCENIFDKNNFAKVSMGNSLISTLNLGTGLDAIGTQLNETNIIISDISGVWGNKTKDDPYIYTPYGYATNLITVPRNLNGHNIIIDPSNVLFNQDDNCNSRTIPKPNYMQHSSIKTYLIYEGPIGFGPGAYLPEGPSDFINTDPSDIRYFGNLLNKFIVFSNEVNGVQLWVINNTGQVVKICPIGRKLMNNTRWGPPAGWPFLGSIFPVEFFRVYIEIILFKGMLWQGSIFPSADKSNTKPQFRPNTISHFEIDGRQKGGQFAIFSEWAANWGGGCLPCGGGIEMKVTIAQNSLLCDVPQIRNNATKQSYMSCLEDKTRKISFTKNTVKQKTIISVPQATIEILPSTTVIPIISGPYTIFKFTNTIPGQTLNIQIKNTGWFQTGHLVVGGGGGGGPVWGTQGTTTYYLSGGGGGGSVKHGLFSIYGTTGQTINIPVTVGAGGLESVPGIEAPNETGYDGSDSTVQYPGGPAGLIETYGGKAGWTSNDDAYPTANGGDNGSFSGGAGGYGNYLTLATWPAILPAATAGYVAGGGGGGMWDSGKVGGVDASGVGGDGGTAYILSEDYWDVPNPSSYGGGGGGGGQQGGGTGSGGGGNGGSFFEGPAPPPAVVNTAPTAGATNSGGGGGGGTYTLFPTNTNQGAAGGSGIVIIRIKTALIS